MNTRREVLRWTIPVDGKWHVPPFYGSIIHVASREVDVVEIWTSFDTYVSYSFDGTGTPISEKVAIDPSKINKREFRVFGTGQEVEGLYVGSALVGPYVWHLYSRLVEHDHG